MSSKSMSLERQKINRRQDFDGHKLFLTNLNGQMNQSQIQAEVKKLFQKYGDIAKLSLKKHKKGYYYFGFLQYPRGTNGQQAVKALDQYPLFGKNMKVRLDRQSQGCFKCGSMSHYARECPQNRQRRRSFSNDRRPQRDDRRRFQNRDRYERRDRDRDRDRNNYRQRERYDRHDRHERHDRDRERERGADRQRDRDQPRYQRRRQRSRSYSDSRSSSESSYYRRNERKERERKQRRRRSRS